MDRQDGCEWRGIDSAYRKVKKASQLYDGKNFELSLEEIEAALEISPVDAFWHFSKALILDSLYRYDEAIEEYQLVLELDPNDLETLNSLGTDFTRTGQYDLALKAFEQAQEIDPQDEKSFCNRIILYGEMENLDSAEQMFYLAQQINPDCSLCFYNLGVILFAKKEYQKAIYCWLRTAEIDPECPKINYYLANAYWLNGDKIKAQEYFLKELQLDSGNIGAIFNLGLVLLALGKIESAEDKFNRILELMPSFTPALFYLGEIALHDKDYNKAEDLYKQALKQDNNMQATQYRLACCSLVKGLKTEARIYLKSELRSSDLSDTFVLTSMGSMFLVCDDLGLATHCLLRAIDSDSSNADAYYHLGLIGVKKEEFKDAIEFLKHALNIRPGTTLFLQVLAVVYSMAGRLKEAEEIVKKLIQSESTPQLKKFKRKIWLAQGKNEFAQRFLLSKIEQKALNHVSSIIYEVCWYPGDDWPGYREANFNIMNLFYVRKAEWRG